MGLVTIFAVSFCVLLLHGVSVDAVVYEETGDCNNDDADTAPGFEWKFMGGRMCAAVYPMRVSLDIARDNCLRLLNLDHSPRLMQVHEVGYFVETFRKELMNWTINIGVDLRIDGQQTRKGLFKYEGGTGSQDEALQADFDAVAKYATFNTELFKVTPHGYVVKNGGNSLTLHLAGVGNNTVIYSDAKKWYATHDNVIPRIAGFVCVSDALNIRNVTVPNPTTTSTTPFTCPEACFTCEP